MIHMHKHYYTPECAKPLPSVQLSGAEVQVMYATIVKRLTECAIAGDRAALPDLHSIADKLENLLEQLCQ